MDEELLKLIPTIVIGALGLYIASQQYIINKNKFKLELSEKRVELFKLLCEIVELSIDISSNINIKNTQEKSQKIYNILITLEVQYYEDIKLNKFINEIREHSSNLCLNVFSYKDYLKYIPGNECFLSEYDKINNKEFLENQEYYKLIKSELRWFISILDKDIIKDIVFSIYQDEKFFSKLKKFFIRRLSVI